jgi:hypothetical protein
LADSAVLSDGSFTLAPPLLQTPARGAACCFTIALARIVGLILNISKEIGRHSHYAGKAEAGEPPRRELDWATFLKKGEPTGKWEVLKCNLASLAKAAKDGAARWEDKMKGEVVL